VRRVRAVLFGGHAPRCRRERKPAENSRARMSPAGTRCHQSSGCWAGADPGPDPRGRG
jgi:hypothetical protein